jgi:hypothetical protein
MRLSRRRFFGFGAAMVVAAASWGVWRTRRVPELPAPQSLPDAPPGPLEGSTMAALLAAVGAVIGLPIDHAHYREYFDWRAAHLRGYQVLYRRFAAALDREARRQAGCAYAGCTAALRRRILDPSARPRSGNVLRDRLRADPVDRDWPLYERYILGEALALFARTDAWVALGYGAWPGVPRGLDRYRRPPA